MPRLCRIAETSSVIHRFLVCGQHTALDRLTALGVDRVSDVKVDLRLAVLLPCIGIIAAAIGAEVRINRVLESATSALGRNFPTGHRNK